MTPEVRVRRVSEGRSSVYGSGLNGYTFSLERGGRTVRPADPATAGVYRTEAAARRAGERIAPRYADSPGAAARGRSLRGVMALAARRSMLGS